MKFIPKAITTSVGRQILKAQKNSPRIMFVAGIGGVVVSTVLACRATLKLEGTLDEADRRIQDAVNSDSRPAVVKAYVISGGDILKLYGPAVVVGAASIGLLTGSHVQMHRRNAALTAAYGSLQTAYEEYRNRVREELGEAREQALYNNVVESTTTVDGKKITTKQSHGAFSPYAVLFDEANRNWQPGPGYNLVFLKVQQDFANERLRARGHVFLNEVHDALGMEHTQAGQQVGWVLSDEGDNYVSFGFDRPDNQEFMKGRETNTWLDFNVDGVVWDKI